MVKVITKPKVLVDICTICNAKCRYCTHQSLNLVKPKIMSYPDFEKITTILSREGFSFIHLYMSGEPLLHPNFLEFLEILSDKEMNCSIASKLNAKVDIEKMDKVLGKHSSLIEFVVTLDAIDQENQSKIAPGISTELVLENLEFLKDFRKKYKILKLVGVIVVNSFNINNLKEIRVKLVEVGCSPIYVKPMGGIIPYATTPEFAAYLEKMVVSTSRFKVENGKIKSKGRMGCTGEPSISPEGNVSVCCHDMLFSINVGNVIEESSLDKILGSSAYKMAIQKRGSHPFCKECN